MSSLFESQAERDGYHGMYWEAVGFLVDGVEADILSGWITSRGQAKRQLSENVAGHEYVTDPKWAVHTLLWSQHACASIISMNVPGLQGCPQRFVAGDSFPFSWFAQDAMATDCAVKLEALESYQALPEQGGEDDS